MPHAYCQRVFHFLFHKFSQGKRYAKASNTTHEGYQYCALEFDDAVFKEMEL